MAIGKFKPMRDRLIRDREYGLASLRSWILDRRDRWTILPEPGYLDGLELMREFSHRFYGNEDALVFWEAMRFPARMFPSNRWGPFTVGTGHKHYASVDEVTKFMGDHVGFCSKGKEIDFGRQDIIQLSQSGDPAFFEWLLRLVEGKPITHTAHVVGQGEYHG